MTLNEFFFFVLVFYEFHCLSFGIPIHTIVFYQHLKNKKMNNELRKKNGADLTWGRFHLGPILLFCGRSDLGPFWLGPIWL
jgi:hypothetical protein